MRGRSFFNPFFILKYKTGTEPETRFGFIVSTKVSKKAVERNRIKRAVREQIRAIFAEFRSGDYVIIVKRKAVGISGKELRDSVKKLSAQSKLISPRV